MEKREKYDIYDSTNELKTTSNTEKDENNKNDKDENLSPRNIISKDSLIYFSEKLKSKFYPYLRCLYACLWIYILDYIVWFISRKNLSDLVNIFSLLFSLIISLYSIFSFKDNVDFVSQKLFSRINILLIFTVINLIIYYIDLYLIFNDKILNEKFGGLLIKIFPNNKGLKMFFGIYLIVNFLFPTMAFIQLIKVRKAVKIVGIVKGEHYVKEKISMDQFKKKVEIK